MVDRVELALAEILDEIDWLGVVLQGRDFDVYRADRALRYAVERSLEIVSEASRRIPDDLKALRPEIPWRAVGGIGNILRHEYHATSPKVVWDTVTGDLASLRAAVAALRHVVEAGSTGGAGGRV